MPATREHTLLFLFLPFLRVFLSALLNYRGYSFRFSSNGTKFLYTEIFPLQDHVNKVTSNISKSVGVMRRLHCQLPANVMVTLDYSLVYSHLTYALLTWGRSGSTNAAKIECAHRRACKLLTDYNQKTLTFHSIYDYFALLKLSTQIPLTFINISKTNYNLINHLICTIPDTEQIVILIPTI